MVLVKTDDFFPADLVVMATSDPDAVCYIETSSLDGEKGLKTRKAPKNFDKILPSGTEQFRPDQFLCAGYCETELPHGNLYQFKGRIKIGKKRYRLEHEHMLLKGTRLKNTKWVVGLVVYTGKETRIMMNSQTGRNKQSDIEIMMNKFTIYIVSSLLVLTLVLAIVGAFWHSDASEVVSVLGKNGEVIKERFAHSYIDYGYNSVIEGVLTFVRYF